MDTPQNSMATTAASQPLLSESDDPPLSAVRGKSSGAGGGAAAPEGVLVGHVWSPGGGLLQVDTRAAFEVALADPEVRIWVDVEDASETMLRELAECMALHPLVAEDVIERNQRAKVEYTDETMHLVVFALVYEDAPCAPSRSTLPWALGGDRRPRGPGRARTDAGGP